MANPRAQKPSQRRHLYQGAHDPNSLLHGGFDYIERTGNDVQVQLLPGDRGRRHLTMADSATEEFRPSRRVLPPAFSGAQHPRPQGLAKIEPAIRPTPREQGLRTNAAAAGRSGYDIPDPGLVMQSKHTVTDDTGRAARDRVSGELTLEKAFGLKRIVSTQRERRGGMPAKGNPGDKNFHHVENSPGFHQIGELTVGSSFYRTMPRREGGLESHMPAAAAAPDRVGHALGGGRYGKQPKLSFKEARREARHVESLREVLELTEAVPAAASATVAGGDETCASWEERTGMHTWPRKNKPLTVAAAAAAAAGVAGAVSESAGVTAGGGL